MARDLRQLVITSIALMREDKERILARLLTLSAAEEETLFAALTKLHADERADLNALPPEIIREMVHTIEGEYRKALIATEERSIGRDADALDGCLAEIEST